MKALVTGANGYLGRNLVDFLTKEGWQIVPCDLPECDITRPLRACVVDCVFHLAAIPGVEACSRDPLKAFAVNVVGSYHVVDFALGLEVPIIFASSQAAKHDSWYGQTKRWIEELLLETTPPRAPAKILRFTNIYGGKGFLEKKKTVVANFIRWYKEGKPLVIHGNGRQKRNFIHVEDACHALLAAVTCLKGSFIVDIGGCDTITINKLASFFPNAEIEFEKDHPTGPKKVDVDLKATEDFLGFTPQHKLEDYIKEVL